MATKWGVFLAEGKMCCARITAVEPDHYVVDGRDTSVQDTRRPKAEFIQIFPSRAKMDTGVGRYLGTLIKLEGTCTAEEAEAAALAALKGAA